MKFGNIDDKQGIDFVFKSLPYSSVLALKKLVHDKPSFHFGAPVWSDKNYKGTLYPEKTPIKNFLKEYGKQFNSIEVNATRYGTPKQNVLENWLASTPDNFKFSMKFPQVITHRKNIMADKSKEQLERFLIALDFIEAKRGVSFAVMANYFKPDSFSVLRDFVEYLPKDVDFAIELRAGEWFENNSIIDEWHNLFLENNITPVITDTPGRRDVMHFRLVNKHLFVRFVGGVKDEIDQFRIREWARRLVALTRQGVTDVWFYAHVPGESRQEVVPFNKALVREINLISDYNLPELIDYSKP